jgi:AAA15 family ATPase/GTPase
MLAQFTVENFLSFDQPTTFSMLAAAGDQQHPAHVVTEGIGRTPPLLRAAAIYGANAAGKSNLVKAIRFARDLILDGTRSGRTIPVTPFRLTQEKGRSSRFEFIFTLDGVPYSYGFVLTPTQILEEWLYATPNRNEVRCFERATLESQDVKIEFGKSFAGKSKEDSQFLEFVARATLPNQLFLTKADDNNVAKVAPVIHWFRDVLTIISADAPHRALEGTILSSVELKSFMQRLLRAADTGIDAIEFEIVKEDINRYLPEDLIAEIEQTLQEADADVAMTVESEFGRRFFLQRGADAKPELILLKTQHRTEQNHVVHFALEEESEGTQRLIHLTPGLFSLKQGREKVVVLDELDRRLHPLLSRLLVETALDCDKETNRSQLIFTTHETSLLDLDLLRRDEIWFVEKDRSGSSRLYSLAEFKPRADLKIEKGYLNGRFGAIPFIGNPCDLGWNEEKSWIQTHKNYGRQH